MTGWAGITMPDHAPRARHDPLTWWDRARANVLSLTLTGLSVAAGGLIATDALVPDGRWVASYSLAMIPVWVQVLIAVLLVGGGVVTMIGVLVRRVRSMVLAPLTTLFLERAGWLMLTFGWGTTAVAVVGNGRVGSTLALVNMIAITLGVLFKVVLLWQLEREVRQEITARKAATDALKRIGGS